MTIDFGKYGLEYTRDLCSSIENYTSNATQRNSQAYYYRGMQLRYAVERWLYIHCINSDALFQHYLASHCSDIKMDVYTLPALTPVESDIAFFLSEKRSAADFPPQRIRQWILDTLRRTYRWLRALRSRVLIPQLRQTRKRRDILIHVVNTKFANYLSPITSQIDIDYFAYLSVSDNALGEQLSQLGYPVVSLYSEHSKLREIFSSYYLYDYSQLIHYAEVTLNALRILHPKSVVVVEGNAPMDIVTSEACRLLGIPCYCIQQGWSPYIHNGFRNMNFTEMFVWGEHFVELLRPYNPELVFRVTGNHAVQPTITRLIDKVEDVRTLGFFLQAPAALLGLEAYEEFIDLIEDVAKSYSNVRVIVREHPGYPLPDVSKQKLQACSNVHFSIPASEPLADVIATSDMVISIFSTVLLEALAMNVVPLICSIGAMQHYEPDIASLGAAFEAQSITETRRIIDEVIAEPARLNTMRKVITTISPEFFSKGDAANTIADRLKQDIE